MRAERKVAPSIRSSTTGPARRVPSGKITRELAPAQHLFSVLERLPVGRLTVDRKGADGEEQFAEPLVLPLSSLVMKKSLRSVQKAAKPKSAKDRCTGARMAGSGGGDVLSPDDLGPEPGPEHADEDHALAPVQHRTSRVDLERLVPPRCFTPARHRAIAIAIRDRRRAGCAHSHDSTSSTTSSHRAPSRIEPMRVFGLCSGDASRGRAIRSRRADTLGCLVVASPRPLWADAVR